MKTENPHVKKEEPYMQKNRTFTPRRTAALLFGLLLLFGAALPVPTAFAEEAAGRHVHVPAGDPTWNWAADHSACTAVFTCADCGEPFALDAAVTKEWQGEGPDKNGGGRFYFIAAVRVNGKAYSDFTRVFETEGYKKPNPCPLDGIDHGDSFFGRLTRFFHDFIYKLIHLFEINKNN